MANDHIPSFFVTFRQWPVEMGIGAWWRCLIGKTWDERIEAAIKAGQRAAFINNDDHSYGTEVREIIEAFCDGDTLYRKVTDPDEIAHYEYVVGGYFWDQEPE